jgi:Flp pilus assembly protein TadD
MAEAIRVTSERERHLALAVVHDLAGRRAESDQALAVLLEKYSGVIAAQLAGVYAARGESDAAFEWLERAYLQRDGGLAELKLNLAFRPIHGDPRWGPFMKKMGFED